MYHSISTLLFVFCKILQTLQASTAQGAYHRICVPENSEQACLSMSKDGTKQGVLVSCVVGRDRLDCLEKIHQHNADFSFMEPEDMYIAANMDNKGFVVLKEVRTKNESEAEYRYRGVAVVRKNLNIKNISSLRGLNSCHTGVGRNVGYKIPVTKLTKMNVIGPLSDTSISPRENELKALSTFFSKACLVGTWAPDIETNIKLKSKYSNLCALCENPQKCDYPDQNSGYEGALNCLTKGGGDIAWTKTIYVENFFQLKGEKLSIADDYAYLCPDGTKLSLDQSPCSWAARPWPGYLADTKLKDRDELRKEISKLNKLGEALESDWFSMALQLSNKTVAVDNANFLYPQEYLSKAKYYDVIGRDVVLPMRTLRWCVSSREALEKCKQLKLAAYSRDVRPAFDCVLELTTEKCFKTIQDGGADIISADTIDVLPLKTKYNLKILAQEKYYNNNSDIFAVAVVKKDTSFNSLKDLKGHKSCHDGYRKEGGWISPISALLEAGLIKKEDCPYAKALAAYFSQSCVAELPADVPGYEELTSLCDKKHRNNTLNCLLADGDVAFVQHTRVLYAIDKAKFREDDVELLCSTNRRAPVNQYEYCNFGTISPRIILTSNEKTNVELDELTNALLKITQLYGANPDLFKLYGSFEGNDNLLFSNEATGIELIHNDESYTKDQSKLDQVVC